MRLINHNYYSLDEVKDSDIWVSKKTYKQMKKNCRRNRSHYLVDKLGRETEVKKINKKYIELETNREVICINDVIHTIKSENCSNNVIGRIMSDSIEKNESVNKMMNKIDRVLQMNDFLVNNFKVKVLENK